MEKGTIINITGYDSGGTVSDSQGRIIRFSSSSFVGKNRSALKAGDSVYFERVGSGSDITAINIRKT